MLIKRKRQPWWLTIIGWALAITMVFAAIPVSAYITTQQNELAPYLVIFALVVVGGMVVAYFTDEFPTWIIGMVIGFCFGFCFATSLTEGWDSQTQIAITVLRMIQIVGSIGLIVAAIWFGWRMNRAIAAITRAVGEEIQTDYLFRDDGQRIPVYADKRRLAGLTVVLAIMLTLAALGLHWALTSGMSVIVLLASIALIGLFGLSAALCAVRLALPGPTMVIGPDGLLDSASVFAYGRGLLRWDEIFTVFVYDRKASFGVTHHYFAVLLTDGKAIQRRMPAWKRLLALPFSIFGADMFVITRSLLDRPPDELVAEIKRYVAEHAPNSWRSPLLDDEPVGEHRSEGGGASASTD